MTQHRTPIVNVLIGCSGSGKSTYAKDNLLNDNTRIVSRDKLREMLYGYTEETVGRYYTSKNFLEYEKEVTKFQKRTVDSLIAMGFDVVLDNTHLKQKYINQILKDFYYCIIKFHLVEADFDTCVERYDQRTRKVGAKVIHDQFQDLKNLKAHFDFKTIVPNLEPIIPNYDLPEVVIFDVDGTLAKMTSGRNPYDWSRVGEDTVFDEVERLYRAYELCGYRIIICTGRDGCCEPETKEWLERYRIDYDEFHIRTAGDQRPDYVIKEEFWRDISTRYRIVKLIDDRNSVVQHARRLGLTCFAVADGDF